MTGRRPGGIGSPPCVWSGAGTSGCGTRTAAGTAGATGGAAAAGDDVERALLELLALGQSTVAEYRGRCGCATATFQELAGGADAVLATAVRLVQQAESEVNVILASDAEHRLTAQAGVDELLTQASGTARVRVLCSPRTFTPRLLRARDHLPAAAIDVRIGQLAGLEAVVVDGRIGLARSDAGRHGPAIVVRSRPVLQAVNDLFDDVWRGAQPPPEPIDLGGPDRAAFARRVLWLLYTGYPDEAAAQELGVSVRTYRRHVAEIVAALGARSRFQAGMRAAAAGLLPPPR